MRDFLTNEAEFGGGKEGLNKGHPSCHLGSLRLNERVLRHFVSPSDIVRIVWDDDRCLGLIIADHGCLRCG